MHRIHFPSTRKRVLFLVFVIFLQLIFAVGELIETPSFAEPIGNVTAPLGREAIMTCVVDNLQMFKVAWLRVDTQTILTIAGHVITKNHRIGVTQSDKRAWRLHIRELRESDRGWYMCQLNTEPMRSQTGYLQVVVPPDIVDSGTSSDVVVNEGESATLTCAVKGSPMPSVTWRRENNAALPLPNGTQVTWWEGGQLTLTKTTRSHSGAYLCIASNGVPPSISKRITLDVQFSPVIAIQNQLVGAIFEQSAVIECHTEASPKPIVCWSREKGDVITNSEKYNITNTENGYKIIMRLQIYNIQQDDLGMYKCISKNILGDTDGTIKLYGIPIPTTLPPTTTTSTTIATTVVTKSLKKLVKSRHNTIVLRPTPVFDYKNSSSNDHNVKKMKEISGTMSVIEWPQRNSVSANISASTMLICDKLVISIDLVVLLLVFISINRL